MSAPKHAARYRVLCGIERCDRPAKARGWCSTHYQAWLKGRDPAGVIPRSDPRLRLLSRVDKPEGDDGCWLLRGWRCPDGYGRFRLDGIYMGAHRAAYLLFIGPIPDGYQVDHVRARGCRHRHCVNPAHLEAVSLRENVMRSTNFTALLAAKTHCPQGHAYDATNTYVSPVGSRQCRTCKRDARRRSDRRRAEREVAA